MSIAKLTASVKSLFFSYKKKENLTLSPSEFVRSPSASGCGGGQDSWESKCKIWIFKHQVLDFLRQPDEAYTSVNYPIMRNLALHTSCTVSPTLPLSGTVAEIWKVENSWRRSAPGVRSHFNPWQSMTKQFYWNGERKTTHGNEAVPWPRLILNPDWRRTFLLVLRCHAPVPVVSEQRVNRL